MDLVDFGYVSQYFLFATFHSLFCKQTSLSRFRSISTQKTVKENKTFYTTKCKVRFGFVWMLMRWFCTVLDLSSGDRRVWEALPWSFAIVYITRFCKSFKLLFSWILSSNFKSLRFNLNFFCEQQSPHTNILHFWLICQRLWTTVSNEMWTIFVWFLDCGKCFSKGSRLCYTHRRERRE